MENELKEIYEKWLDCNKSLKETSKKVISDALDKAEGNTILFYDDENWEDIEHIIITYDGCNHPEYPYYYVYSVYKENGEIFLNTEDFSKYDIDNINADEMHEIAISILRMNKNK